MLLETKRKDYYTQYIAQKDKIYKIINLEISVKSKLIRIKEKILWDYLKS